MNDFNGLLRHFQKILPPYLAVPAAIIVWGLTKIIESMLHIIPDVLKSILNYRVERKRLEIEHEKWQIEKAKILKKIETITHTSKQLN